MQAAFGLEPLAGEAQVDVAGGDMHSAEGEVARLPDLDAEVVGGEHGSADMVGADVVNLPALDDGEGNVFTWANFRWKSERLPGHFSADINTIIHHLPQVNQN